MRRQKMPNKRIRVTGRTPMAAAFATASVDSQDALSKTLLSLCKRQIAPLLGIFFVLLPLQSRHQPLRRPRKLLPGVPFNALPQVLRLRSIQMSTCIGPPAALALRRQPAASAQHPAAEGHLILAHSAGARVLQLPADGKFSRKIFKVKHPSSIITHQRAYGTGTFIYICESSRNLTCVAAICRACARSFAVSSSCSRRAISRFCCGASKNFRSPR